MNILFINACVREGSKTLALCRQYLKRYPADEITELTLNDMKLHPLTGASLEKRNLDLKSGNISSPAYDLARQFASADEIVIAAPYWDLLCPAVLKIYFENISVVGISFGYVNNIPTGFCRAEKLTYITTAGGYIPETVLCGFI